MRVRPAIPIVRGLGLRARTGDQGADSLQVGLLRPQEAVGQIRGDMRPVHGVIPEMAEAGDEFGRASFSPQSGQLASQAPDMQRSRQRNSLIQPAEKVVM